MKLAPKCLAEIKYLSKERIRVQVEYINQEELQYQMQIPFLMKPILTLVAF